MGLFYAYASNAKDDKIWRYVVVFATRDVADEWWRAVSTSTNFMNSIRRVTPQFYTYELPVIITGTLSDPVIASQFLGRVFFSIIGDRDIIGPTAIPVLDVRDHISGDWFYIRSKIDPTTFWDCSQGQVVASTTRRTPFRIRAADSDKVPIGAVMIGSDDVFVDAAATDSNVAIDSNGELVIQERPYRLKFKDFKDGYRIRYYEPVVRYRPPSRGDRVEHPETAIFSVADGSGETWELV